MNDRKPKLCECGCGEPVARRFVSGHNGRIAPEVRFWAKVQKTDTCWLWQAGSDQWGYGKFRLGSLEDGSRRLVQAHRWSYEFACGPIPSGLAIDHLCRNPACVNPDHLEPVTNAENLRRGQGWAGQNVRKTHCPWGHPYDEENTYVKRPGTRACRACHRQRERERKRKLREAI